MEAIRNQLTKQDQILDDLAPLVVCMKTQANNIGQEVDSQNRIIDEVDGDVEKAQGKLKRAQSKLGKVSEAIKQNKSWILIGVLCVLIVVFVILLFSV
jgi:t-SNARE complex subunit (syntaxin)